MQGNGLKARLGKHRNALGTRTGFDQLEERLCYSVTVISSPIASGQELKIVGDAAADTINILDEGNGNVTVTGESGNLLGAADNVSVIRVNSKGGADVVSYTLANPLAHVEKLFFNLGAGADQLSIDLSAGIDGANLHVTANGEAGADTISATLGDLATAKAILELNGDEGADIITVSGAPNVSADSVLKVTLSGNEGKDAIATALSGTYLGKVVVNVEGGKGVDTISTTLTAQAESTGKLRALARGGKGIDNVTLNVIDETIVEEVSTLEVLNAKIIDRPGTDALTFTDNVKVVTGKKA